MKRFLMVLGVVGVGAALYVAAAPGGQTAGPSAKQFKALKKEVASLKKEVTQVKQLSLSVAFVLVDCMAAATPIDEFGDAANQTEGYVYQPTGGAPTVLTTALDVTSSSDPNAAWITSGGSACATDINGTALRRMAARAGVHLPSRAGHPGALRPRTP
jgi:hypothetical protein